MATSQQFFNRKQERPGFQRTDGFQAALEFSSDIFILPLSGIHTEAGREKAHRFEKRIEDKRSKALSAKSRGLARRFFLE
jgi:hypothetical protein